MSVPSGTIQIIPQHGVRGTQRDEPWLSLEDDLQRTRRLIARLAQEVHSSCLVGNPAPIVRDRWERMTHPRVGDLVVEDTARHVADRDEGNWIDFVCKGVGYLVERRTETVTPEFEPDELDPDESPDDYSHTEDRWYIQYGPKPEDLCRWENCNFVAIDIGRMPL